MLKWKKPFGLYTKINYRFRGQLRTKSKFNCNLYSGGTALVLNWLIVSAINVIVYLPRFPAPSKGSLRLIPGSLYKPCQNKEFCRIAYRIKNGYTSVQSAMQITTSEVWEFPFTRIVIIANMKSIRAPMLQMANFLWAGLRRNHL
jgi:hypothetical protein